MPRLLLASNATSVLEEARSVLHDKNTVCFLGEVKSGKTVSSSLLKHALVNHFVPDRADDYQSVVSQGMDAINRSLGDMIIHGQFPAATLPVANPRVVLDVYKMSGGGAGKFEIILEDSSGEHFFNYLVQECTDPHARLLEVLEHPRGSGQTSPLAHYVFARLYVLTIDCSNVSELEHKQSLLANSINALHKLHTAASLTRNEKITSPIAILFTKADLLNDGDATRPATKLLDRMPELKSALGMLHGGELECFMVSISTSPESRDDQDERVRREKLRFDIDCAKINERRRRVDDEIAGKCARERRKVEDRFGEASLEAHMSEYEEKLRKRMNLKPTVIRQFNEEVIRQEQTRRPDKPLSYTHEEYVRLIMWIISQLVGTI